MIKLFFHFLENSKIIESLGKSFFRVRPEGELAYLWPGQCRERWPEGESAYLWLGQCRERWPEEPGHLLGEWVRPQLLDLSLLLDCREHQLWLA